MTKIEKVIAGLQRCCVDNCSEGSKCPYYSEKDCVTVLLYDALEVVKEKEPRVIDISEIYTAKKLDVWIEHTSENIVQPLILIETEMTDKYQTVYFSPMLVRSIKTYGKTWRCWTARPTDEQREAVKWDD